MSTPHIKANKGDFAETVLMPGDPHRAKYIAENFLTDAVLVNDVRGVQGYTGYYNGKRVSVMGSGMGIPSIGIYSYELFNYFGVEKIIRIGTCGTFNNGKAKLKDLVIAMGASTDSNFGLQYDLPGTFAPIADYGLVNAAVNTAEKNDINYIVGNVLSSDRFYDPFNGNAKWEKMGILAIEMEAAGLYMTAAYSGKKALTLLTITDIFGGDCLDADERAVGLNKMIKVALEMA